MRMRAPSTWALVAATTVWIAPAAGWAQETAPAALPGQATIAEPPLTIQRPVSYQVTQREGESGRVPVRLRFAAQSGSPALEWRVGALRDAFGQGTAWAPLALEKTGDTWTATVVAPAGGWYRFEVRSAGDGGKAACASVEPVGVGEVLLVGGQSYGENCNDELLKVQEPQGRVVTCDLAARTWRIAHDPQPNVCCKGGSIWPALGDLLAQRLRVPVGLVAFGQHATSSSKWLPGTPLYGRLRKAAAEVGRFRAVLWQQGESDVLARVSQERYAANLTAIREALCRDCGCEVLWMPAKSTSHPTEYSLPKEQEMIRSAVAALWTKPGFAAGADTDTLTGDDRGGTGSRKHFSPSGQRKAGQMWAECVLKTIEAVKQPAPP